MYFVKYTCFFLIFTTIKRVCSYNIENDTMKIQHPRHLERAIAKRILYLLDEKTHHPRTRCLKTVDKFVKNCDSYEVNMTICDEDTDHNKPRKSMNPRHFGDNRDSHEEAEASGSGDDDDHRSKIDRDRNDDDDHRSKRDRDDDDHRRQSDRDDDDDHRSKSDSDDDDHRSKNDHDDYDERFEGAHRSDNRKCYSQLRAEKDPRATHRIICVKCYVKAGRAPRGDAVGRIIDFNFAVHSSSPKKR